MINNQCDVMRVGRCWPANYSRTCTACSFYSTLERLQDNSASLGLEQ